ncbi:MAG: hypothetical protein JOZ99_04330 [Actinobacteria bacterium]|nr:hypothetical protein [Actinomycetota bacterium]
MTRHGLRVRVPPLRTAGSRAVSPEQLAALLAQSPLPRHVALVLVQHLDRSATRAIRYARSLRPDSARALHVVIDPAEAAHVAGEWQQFGLSRIVLELRDAPDRRLDRAVLRAAFDEMDGRTHVSVVVPRRLWRPHWWALLAHDRSAAALVRAITHVRLEHLTVTVVPVSIVDVDVVDERAASGSAKISVQGSQGGCR